MSQLTPREIGRRNPGCHCISDKVRRAPARKVMESAKSALGVASEAHTSDAETVGQCAALSKSA